MARFRFRPIAYGIAPTEAAWLLGLCQPDVPRLLRGDFREKSLERPIRMLTAFGYNMSLITFQNL